MKRGHIHDARWGATYGVMFGIACSLLAIVNRLVFGPTAFDRFHVGLVMIIAVYMAGGVLCGAIVGLMRRIAATRSGAAATGIVASIPISIALVMIQSQDHPSFGMTEWVISVLIFSIVFGSAAGLALRSVFLK